MKRINPERRNREELGLFAHSRRKTKSSSSSNTASEAKKIQNSLMKTQNLLKNELHRVSNITNVIEEDGRVLNQTMDHHKSLNTRNAKQALTALQRAQLHEQRVLNASIFVFTAVVFYVMWCRVFIKFDFISVVLDLIV